jgi:hypothetical protein
MAASAFVFVFVFVFAHARVGKVLEKCWKCAGNVGR